MIFFMLSGVFNDQVGAICYGFIFVFIFLLEIIHILIIDLIDACSV